MLLQVNYISFKTIVSREVIRFFRLWIQTILPPVITMTLYFLIFGHLIGPRIGKVEGVDYMQFIAPGLIMMSVVNNAYLNVTTSFFMAKFMRNLEEMLITPTHPLVIMSAYVIAETIRGLIVGALVTIVAMIFTHLHLHHFWIMLTTVVLSGVLFAIAGFINGILARSWDDISFVPAFVLTPLTYLGGVFYSLDMLSPFWKAVSHFNPIVYVINVFRYGVLGISDVGVLSGYVIIVAFIFLLGFIATYLMKKGIGIKI